MPTYYLETSDEAVLVEVARGREPRALRAEVEAGGGWLTAALSERALKGARAAAERAGVDLREQRMWAGTIRRLPGRPLAAPSEAFSVALRVRITEAQAAKLDAMGDRSEAVRRLIDEA